MKKTIAAITAGLLLVAGQAVAQNNATARIGDRVGAKASDTSEFAGVPIAVLLLGGAALITLVVVATDDDSESD